MEFLIEMRLIGNLDWQSLYWITKNMGRIGTTLHYFCHSKPMLESEYLSECLEKMLRELYSDDTCNNMEIRIEFPGRNKKLFFDTMKKRLDQGRISRVAK